MSPSSVRSNSSLPVPPGGGAFVPFTRALGHDLRNPIGAILMNARTVLDGSPLRADDREALEDIVAATRDLERTVRNLMDVVGFEIGVFRATPVDACLAEIVRRAVAEQARRALLGDQRIELLLARDPAPLRADPELVQRAVGTLLCLALRFAPRRSTVTVRVDAHDGAWRVQVDDAGPTVSEEQLGALLEPSFDDAPPERAGNAHALLFARVVAEAHGGTMSVQSPLEGGLRVRFDLPQVPSNVVTGELRLPHASPSPADVGEPHEGEEQSGRVLVVDDDAFFLASLLHGLKRAGHEVVGVGDAESALAALEEERFDVIVQDVHLHGVPRADLAHAFHERDPDVAVILVSAQPDLDTALIAMDEGVLQFLAKPVRWPALRRAVHRGVARSRADRLSKEMLGTSPALMVARRVALGRSLDAALDGLWIAWQPIVAWPERRIVAYESLLRSTEPSLPHPGAILEAAEALGRLPELGAAIRARVATEAPLAPPDVELFVNLHPDDLLDPDLLRPDMPMSRWASRIVLEVTERAALDGKMDRLRGLLDRIRDAGFRIAVDDLGSGYAGLTSFAMLRPDVAKLDMSLVRGIQADPTRQRLVSSMCTLCRDLEIRLVAEGVETDAERDTLSALGVQLLQGYLFARPGPRFPAASWGAGG